MYKDVKEAVRTFENSYNLRTEVKMRCAKDIRDDYRILIDATVLSEVLKTFAANFDEFKRQYNIVHVSHYFWKDSTIQLKYKSSRYCFEIHSNFEMEGDCDKNLVEGFARRIDKFVYYILGEVKKYCPSDRYSELYEHLKRIRE